MSKTKSRKLNAKTRASLAGVLARNPKGVTLAAPTWDHGATGPANRIGLVVEERGEKDLETGKMVNPNKVTGVRRVDLLEFWMKRGSISPEGFEAATKLRDAFERTQMAPPCLPDNDRVQASPKPDHAVAIQIERISRFHAIRRHVSKEDRQIVDACVLHGRHPAKVVGALRTREGFDVLREALDRLADSLSGAR